MHLTIAIAQPEQSTALPVSQVGPESREKSIITPGQIAALVQSDASSAKQPACASAACTQPAGAAAGKLSTRSQAAAPASSSAHSLNSGPQPHSQQKRNTAAWVAASGSAGLARPKRRTRPLQSPTRALHDGVWAGACVVEHDEVAADGRQELEHQQGATSAVTSPTKQALQQQPDDDVLVQPFSLLRPRR